MNYFTTVATLFTRSAAFCHRFTARVANYFATVAILFLVLAGCEQTVDADWPAHEEKLVVTGFLQFRADTVFTYVRVNRTQPLSEPFDDSRAIVSDATVEVRSGAETHAIAPDAKFYPLSYDFNYSGVFTRGGENNYQLRVSHEGKNARAEITITDAAPRFEEIFARSAPWSPEYLEVEWSMRLPETRGSATCVFQAWDPSQRGWRDVDIIDVKDYGRRDGELLRGGVTIWAGYGERPRLRYILILQSAAYEDYRNARWSWYSGGGVFEPEAKNPPFNVSGDGIGFFWYEFRGEPVEIVY